MICRFSPLLAVAGLTLMGVSSSWAAPLFTDDERADVMNYWNTPGSYSIVGPGVRADRKDKDKVPIKEPGPYVVRQTPEASVWIAAYNRAVKAIKTPTGEVAQIQTPETQDWAKWIEAKLAYDIAFAGQQAAAANAALATAITTGAGIEPMGAATVTLPLPATASAPGAPNPAPGAAMGFVAPTGPALALPVPIGPLTPLPQTPVTLPTVPLVATVPLSAQRPLPPFPGPIPAALLAAVGNPPAFAAAVAPLRYRVKFESGETFTYNSYLPFKNYPSFRFAQGVASEGTNLTKLPPDELDRIFAAGNMTPFEGRVMRGVSLLEGGFDSINTYDTGYLSVGFIQFATLGDGAGSLGSVLQYEKRNVPQEFARDFHAYGVDVNEAGAIVVVDPATGAELAAGEAVLKVIDDKRLTAVFHLAGTRSTAFRSAQIYTAKAQYYPADLPVSVTLNGQTLTGKVSDVIRSEAGMATLFDRKVNTGNIRPMNEVLAQVMAAHNLTKLEDLLPYEREVVAKMTYRHDFLKDTTLAQPQ